MKRKRAIKRMFLTLMWLSVAAGMGMIITAAMRVQEEGVCRGYDIKIDGFKEGMLFTSKDQIVGLLKVASKGDITGQLKSDFDLPVIEDLLEQSSWVYNADLYFDNNNILHANVTERKPLARVFTNIGESFYIDEAGKHIPLSDKVSLDLPVFTGYPSKKIMDAADSALIQNVIATASFVNGDPFWSAQVAQINISNCGNDCWSMEMIPVVGNHKVELGDGSDIASKFHRLYLFYDQVLKRTGFDKYQKIDVQYNGQVVGVKGNYTKIDSIQLRKNIENLLQQSRETNEMLQVAPAVGYSAAMAIDTSAEAKMIYSASEDPADSILYQQDDTTEAPPVKQEAPAPAVKKEAYTAPEHTAVEKVVKATDKKPVVKHEAAAKKETAHTTVFKEKASVKATKKKPVEKKEESKKQVAAKTNVKKLEAKKTEVKKTDSKKVTTNKNTTSKAEAKKPAAKNTGTVKKAAVTSATVKKATMKKN
ncbi:MAG: cell division protein FtsQ/DivIB [Niabella sp.]